MVAEIQNFIILLYGSNHYRDIFINELNKESGILWKKKKKTRMYIKTIISVIL